MTEPGSARAPRVAPPGSPAVVYADELAEGRVYVDRLRVHHLELVRRFLEAAERSLFTIDLVLGAAMTRSYALVDGFISAFDTWNPIVAAPLLRMQIDSLVRVSYMATAPQGDEVVEYVIGGGEFRRLKDSDGEPLTDRRLLEVAAGAHPWVRDVYEATSGWVHFSPEHVRATWRVREDDSGGLRLSGGVPLRPEQIPLTALVELLGAMTRATEELFGYVETWESRKGLPPGEERQLDRE